MLPNATCRIPQSLVVDLHLSLRIVCEGRPEFTRHVPGFHAVGITVTECAHFIRRMGTFLKNATKVEPDQQYEQNINLRQVDYVTLIDGSTYPDDGVTGEHALEVAAGLA
jgi:hypothetical protein